MINDILAPVKLELQLNWESLTTILLSTEPVKHHPEYYDPTRQIFKFRDDAITQVLADPFLFNTLGEPLAEKLIVASKHIRFINLQIDELLAFRFGDPVMLAEARAYVFKATQKWGKFPPPSKNKIPRKFRAWFQELALRHWAIVNEGCHRRLAISLPEVQKSLDEFEGTNGNPCPKWSDHCDDVCPHCGKHTGRYAPTYRFNMLLMDCPHCGKTSISGWEASSQVFKWFKLKD